MTNFIFDWADVAITAATLDLSAGDYYAHLVTTQPSPTSTTVANLVLPTSAGYAGYQLTNMVYTTQKWSFDNFSFPRYIFATLPPIGMVICKRVGASFASTDPVICYSDFVNSIGQVISGQVGVYVVAEQFMISGAISFAYRYQYSSGSYINGANAGVPFGLLYLLGTANNTTTFTNPGSSKMVVLTSGGGQEPLLFNRDISYSTGSTKVALDFGSRSIKVGGFGYLVSTPSLEPVTIYGSNSLPNWSVAEVISDTNWTPIATTTSATNNSSGWKLAISNSTTFWRYLKWGQPANNMTIAEMELYNSVILSPDQNLIA
jgi:hypothetical protein